MDLKALIAKMDQIDSNKILNEGFPTVADAKARADKEKTTGKFDKKELSTGTQYTRKSSTFDDGGKDKDQKKAEKKKKDESIEFTSAIARGLVEEFGYEIEETTLTENPHANDPEKSAAWSKLSPEDQKWLGGGDPTDPFILARAPNKGKPVAAATPAAAPSAEAPAVSNPQNPGGMSDEEMIARQNPGGMSDEEMIARQQPAAPAIDPAKLKRFQELLAKAGTPAAAPAAAPATGAATKPAATGFANTGGGAAVGNPNMAKQGVKEDPNEGNEFSGELAKAKASGADEFEVDGNKYPVKETIMYNDDQTLLAIKNIRY